MTKSYPAKYGFSRSIPCHLAASRSFDLPQLFSKIAAQLGQTNPAHDLLDDTSKSIQKTESPLNTWRSLKTRATLLQLT